MAGGWDNVRGTEQDWREKKPKNCGEEILCFSAGVTPLYTLDEWKNRIVAHEELDDPWVTSKNLGSYNATHGPE